MLAHDSSQPGVLGHASDRAAVARAATRPISLPPDDVGHSQGVVLTRLRALRGARSARSAAGANGPTDGDNRLPHADAGWVAGSYWRQEHIAICGETREPRRGTGARRLRLAAS